MDKFTKKYNIINHEEIAVGIYSLTVANYLDEPMPGQFVNLYLDNESMLLPRPFSVADYHDKKLRIVYEVKGRGTDWLKEKKDTVSLSIPLGNGFKISDDNKAILIGGGLGAAPMLYLARILRDKELEVFLGFRDEPILVNDFKNYTNNIHIASEAGGDYHKGKVTDLIKSIDAPAFACGPEKMLMALGKHEKLQVSLEAHFGCGHGACLSCVTNTKGNIHKRVCTDGPVFFSEEVILND